jgi:spermidine synthase
LRPARGHAWFCYQISNNVLTRLADDNPSSDLVNILALVLAAVTATATGDAPADQAPQPVSRVVHEEPSQFSPILVIDEGDLRILRFGDRQDADQSTISRSDPRAVPMEYVRWASLGLALVERPRKLLVIGLGGGAYPMLMRRTQPAMDITAVEIDPAVARVARDWVGLREDRRLRVLIDDGAAFVARAGQSWDLILVDAYGVHGIPPALRTEKFFADVLVRLAPNGVAVFNVALEDSPNEKQLLTAIAGAFPACALVRTPDSDNVVMFVGRRLPDRATWPTRLTALQGRPGWPFKLPDPATRFQSCPTPANR